MSSAYLRVIKNADEYFLPSYQKKKISRNYSLIVLETGSFTMEMEIWPIIDTQYFTYICWNVKMITLKLPTDSKKYTFNFKSMLFRINKKMKWIYHFFDFNYFDLILKLYNHVDHFAITRNEKPIHVIVIHGRFMCWIWINRRRKLINSGSTSHVCLFCLCILIASNINLQWIYRRQYRKLFLP